MTHHKKGKAKDMKLYMLIDYDDNCYFIEAKSLEEAKKIYSEETGLSELTVVNWIYAQ